MSESGDKLRSDFDRLSKAWMNSINQQFDMVRAKQKNIAAELKLIPESETLKRYNYLKEEKKRNEEERLNNEIREKLGDPNPVFYIDRYHKEMDKYFSELLSLYEKKLPKMSESMKTIIPKEKEIANIAIPAKNTFDTPIKAYSPKELHALYGATAKTFYSWIKPHEKAIGKLIGKRYTPEQVRTIFSLLGEPPDKA